MLWWLIFSILQKSIISRLCLRLPSKVSPSLYVAVVASITMAATAIACCVKQKPRRLRVPAWSGAGVIVSLFSVAFNHVRLCLFSFASGEYFQLNLALKLPLVLLKFRHSSFLPWRSLLRQPAAALFAKNSYFHHSIPLRLYLFIILCLFIFIHLHCISLHMSVCFCVWFYVAIRLAAVSFVYFMMSIFLLVFTGHVSHSSFSRILSDFICDLFRFLFHCLLLFC